MIREFDCEDCDTLQAQLDDALAELKESQEEAEQLREDVPQYNGYCPLCLQPFVNMVEHYDTCIEWKKVRMSVNGGWPRVCCEDGVLYDERRADEHAARYHHW